MIMNLEKEYPCLYKQFNNEGLFVVSEQYWAGIWPDLPIQQMMIRAFKSRGGLTRGSGFTESIMDL